MSPLERPGPLGQADRLLVSWILAWVAHALRTAPLSLVDPNAFHPLQGALAFSDHCIAGGMLVLPIDAWRANPVLDHNVLVLATFALGGLGTAALVRELGGSWLAAATAGVLAFFGPHRLAMLGHAHALSVHWLPFALLALQRTLRTGSTRAAVGLAATLVLLALSGVYVAYYAALALTAFVGLHVLTRSPIAPGGMRRTLLAAATSGLIVAPVMLPYLQARDAFVLERDPQQAFLMAARGITYLGALVDPLAHLRTRFASNGWPAAALGIPTLALIVAGLWRGRAPAHGGRRATLVYAGTAAVMVLISLGPRMQFFGSVDGGVPGLHVLLAQVLPGFDAPRSCC